MYSDISTQFILARIVTCYLEPGRRGQGKYLIFHEVQQMIHT